MDDEHEKRARSDRTASTTRFRERSTSGGGAEYHQRTYRRPGDRGQTDSSPENMDGQSPQAPPALLGANESSWFSSDSRRLPPPMSWSSSRRPKVPPTRPSRTLKTSTQYTKGISQWKEAAATASKRRPNNSEAAMRTLQNAPRKANTDASPPNEPVSLAKSIPEKEVAKSPKKRTGRPGSSDSDNGVPDDDALLAYISTERYKAAERKRTEYARMQQANNNGSESDTAGRYSEQELSIPDRILSRMKSEAERQEQLRNAQMQTAKTKSEDLLMGSPPKYSHSPRFTAVSAEKTADEAPLPLAAATGDLIDASDVVLDDRATASAHPRDLASPNKLRELSASGKGGKTGRLDDEHDSGFDAKTNSSSKKASPVMYGSSTVPVSMDFDTDFFMHELPKKSEVSGLGKESHSGVPDGTSHLVGGGQDDWGSLPEGRSAPWYGWDKKPTSGDEEGAWTRDVKGDRVKISGPDYLYQENDKPWAGAAVAAALEDAETELCPDISDSEIEDERRKREKMFTSTIIVEDSTRPEVNLYTKVTELMYVRPRLGDPKWKTEEEWKRL